MIEIRVDATCDMCSKSIRLEYDPSEVSEYRITKDLEEKDWVCGNDDNDFCSEECKQIAEKQAEEQKEETSND